MRTVNSNLTKEEAIKVLGFDPTLEHEGPCDVQTCSAMGKREEYGFEVIGEDWQAEINPCGSRHADFLETTFTQE